MSQYSRWRQRHYKGYRIPSRAKKWKHEIDRIMQFEAKSRDEDHFRQLLLTRASRCGAEKKERFIRALREMELDDIAGFIQMLMT